MRPTLDGCNVISRDDLRRKLKQLGVQRAPMTTCMTCLNTERNWASWHEDAVGCLGRETAGFRRGTHPDFEHELRAIALLVSARRDEFDQAVADMKGTTSFSEARSSTDEVSAMTAVSEVRYGFSVESLRWWVLQGEPSVIALRPCPVDEDVYCLGCGGEGPGALNGVEILGRHFPTCTYASDGIDVTEGIEPANDLCSRCTSVCRAEVAPRAREATERLLLDMAESLAGEAHVDPSTIRIGPVDVGEPVPHGEVPSP